MFGDETEVALRWKRVKPVARKEFWENVRNYWIAGITGVLLVLLVVTAYLDALAAGHGGLTDFQATISNNTHLILPLVAIIGLMMGFGTVINEIERGSMRVLLSKPVSRTEVIAGKFVGIGTVLAVAIGVGVFVASAIMLGTEPFWWLWHDYVLMPGASHSTSEANQVIGVLAYIPYAVLYGLSLFAVGIFVSTVARSRTQAIGGVIGVWFLFLIIWDAVLSSLQPIIKSSEGVLPEWYYVLHLLNPVDVFRSASTLITEANMQLLPPLEVWPAWFDLPVFFVVLSLYTIVPVVASVWLFRRRDL